MGQRKEGEMTKMGGGKNLIDFDKKKGRINSSIGTRERPKGRRRKEQYCRRA